MGTKRNPGQFDCYANAAPDEPMFILLGRDRCAPSLVRLWADRRARMGTEAGQVAEALDCARQMDAWLQQLGKVPYDLGLPDWSTATVIRYGHGGGRVFIERPNGARDLVMDLFAGEGREPEARREAILAALGVPRSRFG